MSLRLEMLQVARLAPTMLGEEATALVEEFVRSQQDAATGGFLDRDGKPDLYYTSFAVDCLTALQTELPGKTLVPYLSSFADGEGLDFVHLCCLARLWSAFPEPGVPPEALAGIFGRIEAFRTADGGYNQAPKAASGSTYACFLAYGAYADHRQEPPNLDGVRACVDSLRAEADDDEEDGDDDDCRGGWVNDHLIPVPNVPATAAAVTLCRNLQMPISPDTGRFILSSWHLEQGGFLPFPGAPMPDLLSTAVALHALDGIQVPYRNLVEPCLDFVDTLWTAEGGFHGHWEDDTLDLEYTYYGLLALGHLAV